MKHKILATLLAVAAAVAFAPRGFACTGITLKAADGSMVTARTIEWAVNDNHNRYVVVPRNHIWYSITPGGEQGRAFSGKYGYVGFAVEQSEFIVEGLNEEGLSAGLFYFPGYGKYIAVAIFIVASLTDLADGKIARKYNLVTNFGKFMDPLADKLLVCSAMICLVETKKLAAWIVIIIIAREFIISGFRLVASDNGVVIAASYWGKFKTTFQMLMIIALILDFSNKYFQILSTVLVYVALILTVVSLIDYIVKNKNVLKEQK